MRHSGSNHVGSKVALIAAKKIRYDDIADKRINDTQDLHHQTLQMKESRVSSKGNGSAVNILKRLIWVYLRWLVFTFTADENLRAAYPRL